jgi:hypothetical protein
MAPALPRAPGRNDMAFRIAQISERPLIEEIGITEQGIARRKSFLEFDAEDVETLKGLNEIACEVVRQKEPAGERRPA